MGASTWARLKAEIDLPLRRGGWYRVIAQTQLEVVVDVHGKLVVVPLPYAELRETPPGAWTVLRNPTVAPRTSKVFRAGYLVCPGCQTRIPLPPNPVASQLCPRCGNSFPIAWDERYMEKETTKV